MIKYDGDDELASESPSRHLRRHAQPPTQAAAAKKKNSRVRFQPDQPMHEFRGNLKPVYQLQGASTYGVTRLLKSNLKVRGHEVEGTAPEGGEG